TFAPLIGARLSTSFHFSFPAARCAGISRTCGGSIIRTLFFLTLLACGGAARFSVPGVSFGFALFFVARLSGGFAASIGLFDATLGLALFLPPRLARG